MALEDAQLVLRQVGANNFGLIGFDSDGKKSKGQRNVLDAMSAMNDAARRAFARAVLRSELRWDTLLPGTDNSNMRSLKDSGGLDRNAIIEFCGLCNAAIILPEVCAFLQDGTDMMSSSSQNTAEEDSGTPTDRLNHLHDMMMRAIGFDSDFGRNELKRQFFDGDQCCDTEDNMDDPELHDTFAKFMTNASLSLLSDSEKTFDDSDAGGVTRVVSVKYSESKVGTDDCTAGGASISAPPSHEVMDQRLEEEQRRQLEMAREAALLQQGILDELLAMHEAERTATLAKAKETHDSFLCHALGIPSGQDRVIYLQSISSKDQRLLAMHKLWETMSVKKDKKVPVVI